MTQISRRHFLWLGVLSTAALATGADIVAAMTRESSYAKPAAALQAGQWAMVVDMKRCQASAGCRECTLACHRGHNVPEIGNSQQEVKWIWAERFPNAFPDQQNAYAGEGLNERSFPVLCNHCANPPCVRVCPTQATFQREDGIIQMDYHRCIGCRYCMAACPYGARSFNFQDPRPFIAETNPAFPTREKGVVEKCNFCADRLDSGERPLCVTACPHGALLFGDLADPDSTVRQALGERFSIRRKPEAGTEPKVYYLT